MTNNKLHEVCIYGFRHNTQWNDPHWHVTRCDEHNKYYCMECIGQRGFPPKDTRKTGRPKHPAIIRIKS